MNTFDPLVLYPLKNTKELIFLKNFITKKHIEVGDYTYYCDSENPENFENKNVLYDSDPSDLYKLKIGKFCSIAKNTKFIMPDANHFMNTFTTYPFYIDNELAKIYCRDADNRWNKSQKKKDTVVGNDVWFGYDCLIMPNVTIGDGAIIGTRALVTKDVEPYTIVGGNPAKVIRKRFDEKTIATLLEIKWWNWSIEKILANLDFLMNCDLENLIQNS